MDGFHFDALTRSLSTAGSRRRAVLLALSGTLGLFGASVEETAAKNCKKITNKKKRKKCLAKARCVPSCAGKLCGGDGCGGVCGVACASTHTCDNGRCACTPDCAGKACGPDGRGGVCGPSCVAPETCQNGTCGCTPNCAGKSCGPDGCNGWCGFCFGGTCSAGVCDCGGKEPCRDGCYNPCPDGRTRRPDTCFCCFLEGAGPFADEAECRGSCCSHECDPHPSGLGYVCTGLPLCAPCTFDAECADGEECQGGRCGTGAIIC